MQAGESLLAHTLSATDAMEGKVEQVIRQLPLRGTDGRYLVDDEQVRTAALCAQSASKAFWKLACAARAEIVRRIDERASDSTNVARAIAHEASEQGVSPRILRRDASIGQAFGPLFANPDTAPDLDRSYYSIALRSPDPPAALALAQAHKDANPFYSTSDFEADLARVRMADPAAGYGADSKGRCALAYVAPFWSEGVVEAAEKAVVLPLRRVLFPDAIVIVRAPPRALDLGMRILGGHDIRYQTTVFAPVPPYRDSGTWHEFELLLVGTLGKLRLPDGLPGTWRDPKIERCIDMYFSFATPKLAAYPRHGMALGEGWVMLETLAPNIM